MENPKIRFKGFTKDWEQRKLGEVSESYSGGTPSVGNKSYYGGSIPFIRSAEINSESTELFLTEEGLTNSSARMVSKGDILYALYGATSGETGRSRINGAINQAILAILPHDGYDSEFLMQWLRKSKQNITDIYLQGGQGNLSGAIVKALEVNFPSLAEQRQIGNYFQSIDKLITLHQRKCEQTKKLKKYMLQKMFPRNGAKVPEIRFYGFTYDWEQRKLSEITTMHARIGWQNLRTSEFLDSGDYMLITGTDFNDGAINYSTCHFVERERYEQDKHIQIKNGSILITKDGTLGKVAYVQGLSMPATLNAGVFNVEIKDETEVNDKYLFQYLKAPFLMDYVNKKATGGTIKHLNQNILVDFPVFMPSKAEQEEIGTYFEKLDNLITLHQRKCDELKKMKKYMLQNMFI